MAILRDLTFEVRNKDIKENEVKININCEKQKFRNEADFDIKVFIGNKKTDEARVVIRLYYTEFYDFYFSLAEEEDLKNEFVKDNIKDIKQTIFTLNKLISERCS